jgi:hypothetical protein
MDSRQVAFVAAALADELRTDGVELPPERLTRVAEIATKSALTWMIGAAKEGMIESVHVVAGSMDDRSSTMSAGISPGTGRALGGRGAASGFQTSIAARRTTRSRTGRTRI